MGRWRSLSRKHIRLQQEDAFEHERQSLHTSLSFVRAILQIAGISIQCTDTLNKINDKIRLIDTKTLELNKLINEEVVSCHFEPIVAATGDVFYPVMMEDEYADESSQGNPGRQKVVFCGISVGLNRWEGVQDHGTQGWRMKEAVLVKSKIVLERTVMELV